MKVWRQAAASAGLYKPKPNQANRYSVIAQDKVITAITSAKSNIQIDAAHGSFDNDVTVISKALERIRRGKLLQPVDDLRGF